MMGLRKWIDKSLTIGIKSSLEKGENGGRISVLSRLQTAVMNQNFEWAFLPAFIPVPILDCAAGWVTSIPASIAAAALAISCVVRALFANAGEKEMYWNKSVDYSLLFASQIFNLCSFGVFNKIAAKSAERRWARGTLDN